MKTAIIASSKDPAGVNIRSNLIRLFEFKDKGEKFGENEVLEYTTQNNQPVKLYFVNEDLIFAEDIDQKIDADILVFASKHRSKENTPAFTVHPIGNFGGADFGGRENALCPSLAFLLKRILIGLNENFSLLKKEKNFQVTMEATHHGPYVKKPAVFVEIGSTDNEWSNTQNGELVAKTIISSIEKFLAFEHGNCWASTLLIGGGHYAPAANRAMLSTNYAIGHICPKHTLEHLTEGILMQSIDVIIPKPNIILLDWKGLGQHKQKIVGLLDSLKIKHERVQNVIP